jgi:tetratricopeptide (TPR) repeat protein
MVKTRRLNKSLIAFLTLMGIILVVSVAALVIRQSAQRDPELLARQGRDQEQAGDPERLAKALRLYGQAYAAAEQQPNTDRTKYALDIARCSFQLGGFTQWLDMLRRENARVPDDRRVLRAVLEGLWRLKELQGYGFWWQEWADYATRLLQLDTEAKPLELDEKVLGAVCRAWGLWNLRDVRPETIGDNTAAQHASLEAVQNTYGNSGDEAAVAAFQLAPHEPRVAVTQVEYLLRQGREKLTAAAASAATMTELTRQQRNYVEQVEQVLVPAVGEHPDDVPLVLMYGDVLRQEATVLLAEDQAGADALLVKASAAIEKAVQGSPDNADLDVGFAQHLLALANYRRDTASADEINELYARATRLAQHAAEVDPAAYDAYAILASTKLLAPDASGSTALTPQRFDAALKVLEDAQARTLTLRSLRAILRANDRLLMLLRAFETAMDAVDLVQRSGDAAQRAQAMTRAKAFLDDVETKWPDSELADYMRGGYALADGDNVTAIKAFERANEKRPQANWWLAAARVGTLPAEQLAMLYRENNQFGEALKYAEQALGQYEQEANRLPPARLVYALASLYRSQLDESQGNRRALDLLTRCVGRYPTEGDNRTLKAAQAEVLAALGHAPEAEKAVASVVGANANPGLRLWEARLAMDRHDFANAEELSRGVLNDSAASDAQVRLAVQLLLATLELAGRTDEAREQVQKLLAAPPRPTLERLLRAYAVVQTESDPGKRDEKFLALIAEEPDALARAEQYADFYVQKRNWEKAVGYVAELRRLRPDDLRVAEREFRLRIQLGQLDRATELLPPLAQADGGRGQDSAGGATYRGELEYARGNADLAIREFRQAVLGLPKSAELQTWLARAYLLAGRTTEAIEALRRAIEINTRHTEAYGLLTDAYDDLAAKAVGPEREEYTRLAAKVFEDLAKLAPQHPYVLARQKRAAENADPRKAIAERQRQRAEKPDDLENLGRLGELYHEAWTQADKQLDAAAKAEIAAQADAFFTTALAALSGANQIRLAQRASDFYADAQQREKGETLLRGLVDQQSGTNRVSAQLQLAQFLERAQALDAAERELQATQRLVAKEITDSAERTRLSLRVGLILVSFYQRWSRPGPMVETCRWLLDQLHERGGEEAQAVRLTLIDGLLTAGQFGDAETEINSYLQAYGDDVRGLVVRARLFMARNQRDRARADLTAVLQKDPENTWALQARGWLALQAARYDAARDDLQAARAKIPAGSPAEPRVRSLLANLYEATGQIELSINERRALLSALTSSGARGNQVESAVADLVRLYRKNNQLDQAQQLISEYMEKYPDEPNWPMQLGLLLESKAEVAKAKNDAGGSRDFAAASSYYQRAADKSGSDQNARIQSLAARIAVLRKAGQPRDAIDLFKSLPFDRPAWPLRLAVARAHWDVQEREQALQQWREALQSAAMLGVTPMSSVANELRSTLLPADAEQLLRGVLSSAPADSDLGLRLRIGLADHLARNLGQGTEAEGKRREALGLLKEVLEKAGVDAPERLAALMTQARVQEAAQDVAGAVASYEQILQADQNSTLALNNLAYLLTTTEDAHLLRPQEALKYAERLESLIGDNRDAGNMLDTAGWVYFRYTTLAGRDYQLSTDDRRAYVERAAAALERSLSLDPAHNLSVYAHLGQVYLEQGRGADARVVYNRGLVQAQKAGDEPTVKHLNELLSKVP